MIKNNPDRISLLRPYENQHNWKGLEFPVSIKKIDKFEKNNPGIAVNVFFSRKKSHKLYTGQSVTLSAKSRLTY